MTTVSPQPGDLEAPGLNNSSKTGRFSSNLSASAALGETGVVLLDTPPNSRRRTGEKTPKKPVALLRKKKPCPHHVKRSIIDPSKGFLYNVKAFFNGPYFEIIPPAYEEIAAARYGRNPAGRAPVDKAVQELAAQYPDFLSKLKKVVVEDWRHNKARHMDHHLEAEEEKDKFVITKDQLVPIPFDAPQVHTLMVEFFATVFLIVQSTVVMFLAIMVENTDRRWKDKGNYQSTWLPLIKALVILYPLVTLIIMVVQALEVTIKKFMYYRLLSMRILLDWENYKVWQGSFFYYFICTWVLLNTWAVYGLIAYWGLSGNKGADATSVSTFIVVNLQTIQLLIQYYRVMTAEQRLVSLNEIFERAPVEAQSLLQYTYIVEEDEVIEECYHFLRAQWRRLLMRVANLLCCGLCFKDWPDVEKVARFDVYNLRRKAGNTEVLDAEVRKLLRVALQEEGCAGELAALDTWERVAGGEGGEGPLSPRSVGVVLQAMQRDSPAPPPPRVDAAARLDASAPPTPSGGGAGGGGAASTAAASSGGAAAEEQGEPEPACCSQSWWQRWWRAFWWATYIRMYASLHSVLVASLPATRSWPFRPDKPYFRFFTAIQIVGGCLCCLIILFGLLGATSSDPCSKGNKACDQCTRYVDTYLVANSTGAAELADKGVTCQALLSLSDLGFCTVQKYLYPSTPAGPTCPAAR